MTFSAAATLGLAVLLAAPPEAKPVPKFKLSKETTYIVEPLDKDGYLDYETALNERLRGKITPETNAVVLLMQAIGPKPDGKELHADWWKWLGAKPPQEKGEYFVDRDEYRKQRFGYQSVGDDEYDRRFRQESYVRSRPWTRADFPFQFEWLEANASALDLARGAANRPHYFNPLTHRPKDGSRPSLVGSFPSWTSRMRGYCEALCVRAMVRLEDKKHDEAWSDLATAQRLSRQFSNGTTIELLIGLATETLAIHAATAFIATANGGGRSIEHYRKEWERIPSPRPLDQIVNLQERYSRLDMFQTLHATAMKIQDEKRRSNFDAGYFESLQRETNEEMNRIVSTLRENRRPVLLDETAGKQPNSREAFDGIGVAISFAMTLTDPEELTAQDPKKVRRDLSELHSPRIYEKLRRSSDRLQQLRNNLQIAFALAEYRTAAGSYPQKLADLVPKYLAKVPDDIFSEKPPIYKPAKDGYLLYSFGANGKDDGGKTYGDEPYGCDDLVVRVPLPKLKRE